MKFKRFCLIIGLILQVVLLFSIDIPEPVGFVNDFANLLSEETRNKINDWAIELREKTDVDFVIVTLPDSFHIIIFNHLRTVISKYLSVYSF